MHCLFKNTSKSLFAIINEFEAEDKFIKFVLTAGAEKNHIIYHILCDSFIHSFIHSPMKTG